jgi:hypothetical protein
MPPAGYEVFKRTKYFGSLNGLRAVSIIAVIWHHTASSSFSAAIAGQGFYGVTLFFVISGFLITTLLLREKEHAGTISLGGFYVRRDNSRPQGRIAYLDRDPPRPPWAWRRSSSCRCASRSSSGPASSARIIAWRR